MGAIIAMSVAAEDAGGSALDGKVIRFAWDMPDAQYLARHAEEMERSGLDGVVVDFTRRFTDEQGGQKEDSVRSRWISSQPVRLKEIQHNITALKAARFRRFTDNFLCMYANAGPGGPECFFEWDRNAYPDSPWKNWPDDPRQYLNTFRENMVLAARVCRKLGIKGFFIDQEMYGSWTQMRSDWPMEAFQEPLETVMARARDNVADVFRAACREYPDITIILIPGGQYRAVMPDEIAALDMAFTDGILMGLGPRARLFDGQETAYDLCRYERFVQLRSRTRRTGLRYTSVPDLYRKRMQYGFGIWLDHRARAHGGFSRSPYLNHFTPSEFGNALYYALRASDGYVWIYGEDSVMWPAGNSKNRRPNVSDAYLEAIRTCRQPRPLNLGRDPRAASNDPLPPPSATIKTAGDTFAQAAPGLTLIAQLKDGWKIWFDREDRGLWSLIRQAPHGDERLPWRPIRVGECWERQGYAYNGYAWYKTTFELPSKFKGREIFLVLGGLGNKCQVYVNGRWSAMEASPGFRRHDAGPLLMNLSEYDRLKFGEKNLLCIYVINPRGPGGLWKPVWLAAGKPKTGSIEEE